MYHLSMHVNEQNRYSCIFPLYSGHSISISAQNGYIMGKRQKAVRHLATAPQGGTQKYTLAFAYDSPR